MCLCQGDLDSVQRLRGASDAITGDTDKWDHLMLCNEICQPLEDLHKRGHKKFPNQCTLKIYVCIKDHSKYKVGQWILRKQSVKSGSK